MGPTENDIGMYAGSIVECACPPQINRGWVVVELDIFHALPIASGRLPRLPPCFKQLLEMLRRYGRQFGDLQLQLVSVLTYDQPN